MSCSIKIPHQGKLRWAKLVAQSEVFKKGNTGFALYDLDSGEMISEFQSEKKFTPASNIKVLTSLLASEVFGDSIPAIHYAQRNDSLLLFANGFPGFGFTSGEGKEKLEALVLQKNLPVKLMLPKAPPLAYGAGWMWDDSGYAFQVPINAAPIFGNRLKSSKADGKVLFADSVQVAQPDPNDENNFLINQFNRRANVNFPFYPDDEFIANHLIANQTIDIAHYESDEVKIESKTINVSAIPFHKKILEDSDNFVAEQLLIMVAVEKFNSWDSRKAIKEGKKLLGISEDINWADGSGLSRYNAVHPKAMIDATKKLIDIWGLEMAKEIMPAGGEEGTIKNFYKSLPANSLFAKTGTMRYVHCLSGILVTNSGKNLLFSFMHNQIPGRNLEWKQEMERVLMEIQERN